MCYCNVSDSGMISLDPRVPSPFASFHVENSRAVQCFHGAIEACAYADDFDACLSLMAEMGRVGIRPDDACFRPLVAACGRNLEPNVRQNLQEAMTKLGYGSGKPL